MNSSSPFSPLDAANDADPSGIATDDMRCEAASRGYLFLDLRADQAHLHVPVQLANAVSEMRSGKEVLIYTGEPKNRPGAKAVELVFDDHSDSPFSVCIDARLCSARPLPKQVIEDMPFTVHAPDGETIAYRGRYRRVRRLPHLLPWRYEEKNRGPRSIAIGGNFESLLNALIRRIQ